MLEQQPAGEAARLGIVSRGKLDQVRYRLGLLEIMLGRLADRRAFERHNALIAFGGSRLVEGDREEAFAEQREQGRVGSGLGQPLGIEFEITAQLTAAIIADEQFDRAAAGLRLARQLDRMRVW